MSRRSKHSPGADGLPPLERNEEGYDDFSAGREAFLRLLGEPLFLEDFPVGATVQCTLELKAGDQWITRTRSF